MNPDLEEGMRKLRIKDRCVSALAVFAIFLFGVCSTISVYRFFRHPMPPGYTLQTDGYNWRFIALENDYCFTNYCNDGTRLGTIKEAWKIHRANQHEWRDVK